MNGFYGYPYGYGPYVGQQAPSRQVMTPLEVYQYLEACLRHIEPSSGTEGVVQIPILIALERAWRQGWNRQRIQDTLVELIELSEMASRAGPIR